MSLNRPGEEVFTGKLRTPDSREDLCVNQDEEGTGRPWMELHLEIRLRVGLLVFNSQFG